MAKSGVERVLDDWARAASNWATLEWVMSGTPKGDFPGMPATGKRFSVRA